VMRRSNALNVLKSGKKGNERIHNGEEEKNRGRLDRNVENCKRELVSNFIYTGIHTLPCDC